MKEYDWKEIQKYYDEGNSTRKVSEKFNINTHLLWQASKKGYFLTRSPSDAQKLSQKLKPRKHSEETKKKLSKLKRKFLEENPDKVPYLLNHHSKGMSYPEKYFEKAFRNENVGLTYHFRIGLYELDFSDPIRKIDIEIDGEQHYVDKRIVESDKRRDKYLEDRGWIVYRVRWSRFSRLKKEFRKMVVQEIKALIEDFKMSEEDIKKLRDKLLEVDEDNKKTIKTKRLRKTKKCQDCEKIISESAKRCNKCAGIAKSGNNRKVERPSKEELEKMIKEMSWTAIGKMYNVSDNAVRKWAKSYNIIWKKRKHRK